MFFDKEFIECTKARIAAMYNAQKTNKNKMHKVYSVDQYWLNMWNPPATEITERQKDEVRKFWDRYSFAYQNNIKVQEHFSSLSGHFDPRYCANGLNSYYMFRYYDDPVYHTPFHDKNYREFLFHDVAYSPAFIHRVRGHYYDSSFNHISYDQAMTALEKYVNEQEEKLIVKPTPGGGGNGISFIRPGDTKNQISAHLDGIKKDDVIIEHFLEAHASYAIANPTSLNTLRIITFLYDNEISVIGIVFRMGAEAKEVDNFTQGGVACGVSLDGVCMDYGTDHFGNVYNKHPNGFEFAGHKLYGVDAAIQLAKKLHWRVPQFKQMSWDIAIDKRGLPIFIEMNPRGEANLYQMIGKLPFGDRTEEVLDDYLFALYYNIGANWHWDYKEYADHIVLTNYGWNKKRVVVPEQINGKTVTHIGAGCFTGDRIREIVVPGCVKNCSSDICNKVFISRGGKITQLEDKRGIVVPAPLNIRGQAKPGVNILHWDCVDGVTQYYIYRMKQGGKRELIRVVSGKSNIFKDYNVLSDTTYFYYVRSYSSACGMQSEWQKYVAIHALPISNLSARE